MIASALLLMVTLQSQIETISKQTDAVVGVTAIDIESGRRISVHGKVRFPMASVFKFPVALVALQSVDAGDNVPRRFDHNRAVAARAVTARCAIRPTAKP